MFDEQVFVLGQPNIVTQVTVRTVVCVRRTLQCDIFHIGVTHVTPFGVIKGN